MAYTETTTKSYGSRVKNSFGGILFGIVCFIAGTVLLWWNEGRAVKTADAIEDAENNVVEMKDVSKIDKSYDGKLVHATGTAISKDELTDDVFGFKASATRLVREVNYYQWVEHKEEEKKDKIGGGEETITTYTYSREWTSSPVKSSDFDPNAVREESRSMNANIYNFVVCNNIEGGSIDAKNVTFGAYKFPEFLISEISGAQDFDVTLTDEVLVKYDNSVRKVYADNGRQVVNSQASALAAKPVQKPVVKEENDSLAAGNDSIEVPTEWEETVYDYIHTSGNVIYLGANPDMPEIGDMMIKYQIVPSENELSIIAQVESNTFTQYVAGNGKNFSRLSMGIKSSAEMIQDAKDENTMWTWILRIVGILVVIGGIKGVLNIFVTLAKILPFISNILNFGANVISTIFGLIWSLIIIAIAWLFYRPILAICILLVIGAIVFFAIKMGKKKAPKETPAEV